MSRTPSKWHVVVVSLVACACTRASSVDSAGIAERLAASKASAPAPAPHTKSPIGTNLAPVNDWSTERPFADLMKQSRAWISNTEATWDDGRPLELDAHGWPRSLLPGQRARSLVMWGEPIPAGDYVVTWSGSGALDFWPQQADVEGHRAVVHADPQKGGLAVTITATDKKDPIKDIHVWRKGEESGLFSRAFLSSLQGYSTLRFMDWMQTNDAKVVHFKDRPVVEDARWTDKGVPLEVMVDLCNAAGADMWLTVPDTWDDDALTAAARLVHDRLHKDLVLYVESSNEVWNGMFPQAKRAQTLGVAHKLARDPYEAQLRRHAERSVEVFRAFAGAFAKDQNRLVRTLGSQVASPWVSDVMLSTKDVAKNTDALAVAPYVGNEVQDAAAVDAVFTGLAHHLDQVIDTMKKQAAVAAKYKVRLVAYEGGQHLVAAGSDAATKVFIEANRDPRMKDVYLRLLRAWKEAGGGLFVHYFDAGAPSKFGSWGAREGAAQARAKAPKYDALMAFAQATPRWW